MAATARRKRITAGFSRLPPIRAGAEPGPAGFLRSAQHRDQTFIRLAVKLGSYLVKALGCPGLDLLARRNADEKAKYHRSEHRPQTTILKTD